MLRFERAVNAAGSLAAETASTGKWGSFRLDPHRTTDILGPCRKRKRVLLPLAPPPQDKRQACSCRNRLFAWQIQWCASIILYFYENC
jgi:hypothetical protein